MMGRTRRGLSLLGMQVLALLLLFGLIYILLLA
jgi:hypothetical protein